MSSNYREYLKKNMFLYYKLNVQSYNIYLHKSSIQFFKIIFFLIKRKIDIIE